MRKRFSAAMALALSCAMVLTACSGGSKPAETTAAAAADTTAAAAETTAAAAAAPSGDAQKLTMGTGGTTGTYYAFGGVIANVLNSKDIGVNINVQSTGASKANIYLVNDGEADLAIVQNDVMDMLTTELTSSQKKAQQKISQQLQPSTLRFARSYPPAISNLSLT